jgi:hypothetical protein
MKSKYFGYEFRSAVETAIHKMASDLSLGDVEVHWTPSITTAGINRHGNIYLCNVRDDAIMTRANLMRYVGFAVHELLHRKYTDFNAVSQIDYVDQLCNALEDARIEHLAIDNNLTGNVTEVLTVLIDGMVAESLMTVQDWADPAQYPFVLAVYTRKHAKTKVPLALGLAPIFDEAVIRLDACTDSMHVLKLAQWVFDQLSVMIPQKPLVNPPKPPTRPSNDEGEGEDAPEKDKPSNDGQKPTGPAKRPTKNTKAREVEPENKPPEDAGGGGYYRSGGQAKDGYHVSQRKRFPIPF